MREEGADQKENKTKGEEAAAAEHLTCSVINLAITKLSRAAGTRSQWTKPVGTVIEDRSNGTIKLTHALFVD